MKNYFLSLIKFLYQVVLEFNYRHLNNIKRDFYQNKVNKKSFNIGKGVKINGKIKVTEFRGLILGNNVHIGDNAYFNTEGGLVIGDNTHISRNVTIYTSSHNYNGELLPYDRTINCQSVVIEKNCWIGMNVNIAPGVTIGEGSIIGIGTTVNESIPANSIVIATSGKIIKKRDAIIYKQLNANNLFSGINGLPFIMSSPAKPFIEVKSKVFIVSTGRAGSESISSILNQNPDINAFHEPHWQLLKTSTEFEYGIIDEQNVESTLKDIYLKANYFNDKIYVESDQKISNLIYVYSKLYPDAKFIWLIREPYSFVKSAVARGWFLDENRFNTKGRLLLDPSSKSRATKVQGNHVGEFSNEEWFSLSQTEKCAWYWYYWNNRIYTQLSNLDSAKYIKVKLETLSDDVNLINKFLNTQFDYKILHKNKVLKQHKLTHNQLSVDEKSILKYCQKGIEKWL